jgi:GNAT superfamily N-acetyltransferase
MLNSIQVTTGEVPADGELVELYEAVGWTAYTRDPELLSRAVKGSTLVATARFEGQLLGLARVVSDGASICYLQDVLVRPELQREGVGRQLVEAVLKPYDHVRQKVLLTDDEPQQRAFYERLGYSEIRDVGEGRLRAFVRFDGADGLETLAGPGGSADAAESGEPSGAPAT